MAVNKQEVIIEFNAETNDAERSVNSLTDSYSDLEKKIDDVASAQQRQAALAKNQGKQITDVTKAVDKVTDAEKQRANVEKGAIDKRNSGSKTYGDNLTGVLGKVTSLTGGQTSFIQKGIDGFKQLKDGVKGLTSGLGLVKGAVAATGIGLLVTAGIELVGWVSDFMDSWEDNSAEESMQRLVAGQKEITQNYETGIRLLEIQGAGQRKILEEKQKLIESQIRQSKYEEDLAREQGDQERILAEQTKQKQLQVDLTILQAEKEQIVLDKLERYKRLNDENYDAQQQRLEDIGEEEERLKKVRGQLRKLPEDFVKKLGLPTTSKDITFKSLGLTELTEENIDTYIQAVRDNEKKLFEAGELLDHQYDAHIKQINQTINRVSREHPGSSSFGKTKLEWVLDLLDDGYGSVYERIDALRQEEANLTELIDQYNLAEENAQKNDEAGQVRNDRASADAQRRADEAQRAREQLLMKRQELEDELYKLTLEAQDQEELAAMQAFDKRVAIAGDDEGLLKMAEEQLQKDLQQIRFKYEELRQQEMLKGEDEDLDPRIVMLEKYYAAAQVLLQQDLEVTRDMELTSIEERYATQLALAEELGLDKEVLLEAQRKEEYDINQKWDKLDEERERMKGQMRRDMVVQSFQAIEALGKAFASQDEADAERSFKVQKGLSIASATVSAVNAVINAFMTAQGSPYTKINPAYPFIQAGIAAAFGTAQVATIARQQYTPSGTPNDISAGGGAGGGQGLAPPTIDLSFLGEGAGQSEPIRAYVLAENVSNAQQANQKILDQTTL